MYIYEIGCNYGKIVYYWNPLIKAVRLVVLFTRSLAPFASAEGSKVYLAEDLGLSLAEKVRSLGSH